MEKNTKIVAALAGAALLLGGTIFFVTTSGHSVEADGTKIKELPELSAKISEGSVRVSGFKDEETGKEYIVVQSNTSIAVVPRGEIKGVPKEKDEVKNDGILVPIDPRQKNGESMEDFMRRMQDFFQGRRIPR